MRLRQFILLCAILTLGLNLNAQESEPDFKGLYESMNQRFESLNHRLDEIEKAIDDVYWYNKVGDLAYIALRFPEHAHRR